VEVRPARPGDLDGLERALPLDGPWGHRHRLAGQDDDRWLYLLVQAEERAPEVVGSCLVHWDGPTDDVVREAFPDCVEITSLHVVAAARGRGAGQMMIAAAERAAAARGRTTIGIGVEDGNDGARRLYERLGYRPSNVAYVVEYDHLGDDGELMHAVERCTFLVKSLEQP
jgi:ribosomal protein S18 acetylase RimI-like enzyme